VFWNYGKIGKFFDEFSVTDKNSIYEGVFEKMA